MLKDKSTAAVSAYSCSGVCLYFKDLLRLPAGSESYTHEKYGFVGMKEQGEIAGWCRG